MLMTSSATGSSERSTPRTLGLDDNKVAGSEDGVRLIKKLSKSKDLTSLF